MAEVFKVIGPPGTGKSYYLVKQIMRATDKYDPDEIVVVSYTKAATEEIASRIHEATGYKLPYVKTLHALCYHLLHLSRDKVAEQSKWVRKFNEQNEYFAFDPDGALSSNVEYDVSYGTECYRKVTVYRNRLIPISKWSMDAVAFYNRWQYFCRSNDLYDYTSMIEIALLRKMSIPTMKILFVDESQDTTPLQMELLKSWYGQCEKVIMSGDANQAIYRFSGASPEVFRDMDYTKRIVLDKSYRLPEKVLSYSNSIIRKSHDNELVEFNPRVSGGRVLHINSDGFPDFSMSGSHMILARCNYQVNGWIRKLKESGILFYNPYRPEDKNWNPLNQKVVYAVNTRVKLSMGYKVSLAELQCMVDKTIASKCFQKKGYKKRIMSMRDNGSLYGLENLADFGFKEEFINFYGSVTDFFKFSSSSEWLKHVFDSNPFIFEKSPRVIVGTIHSVKGGEADHVWVDANLPVVVKKGIRESSTEFNDEVRVCYVAITRARETVGIIGNNYIYGG